MKTKTIALICTSTMLVLILIVNVVYYITIKDTFVNDQEKDINMLLNTIETSIKSTQYGEYLFEQTLAEELRLASIAAQYALPPKIEEVSNEQLIDVRNKLLIEDITLFKYIEEDDDFIGYKSSDPKQIGLRTNGWSNGKWTNIFKELMDKHDATPVPNFGENLRSFWSGPYDTSSSDPTKVNKWGYYNDGTTDYLIDPYIASNKISQFKEKSGVDTYINGLIENNDFLIEISVLNDKVLQGEWESYKSGNVTWHSERMVLHGDYNFSSPEDLTHAKQAFDDYKEVHTILTINNQKVLKSYLPIELATNVDKGFNRLILIATSDLDTIEAEVQEQTIQMLYIGGTILLIGGLILWGVLAYIDRQNKIVSDVQDMYMKNINSLFKTLKEYRHDFNNQIYTLTGLCGMKKYDELEDYLRNLSNINTSFNDIIDINIPAFSGLLQTKIAYASENGITFEHHFEGFNRLQINTRKTTDLVRVIGNIIDNAFYAVRERKIENKKVTVIGMIKKGHMVVHIINNGSPISPEKLTMIFDHGFSTKPTSSNSGLGLAIVKEILQKYKGTIDVTSNDLETSFTIKMPLSNREMLSESA